MKYQRRHNQKLDQKLGQLRNNLRQLNGLLVAFSGGVDSSFLLAVAHQELKDRVVAVTAVSENFPEWEKGEAEDLAEKLEVRHRFMETSELDIPGFASNPPDRCYLCKSELFDDLWEIAKAEKVSHIADGTTADDCHDHRPGRRAAKEKDVLSPLLDAGLTKEEIRTLSKQMQLPTWNKPSFACLASRFPYGMDITKEKIKQVELAEDLLRKLGFKQFRVRHHNAIARIEIEASEIERLVCDHRQDIVEHFKGLGFHYITVDLEGYRTGSMNEV